MRPIPDEIWAMIMVAGLPKLGKQRPYEVYVKTMRNVSAHWRAIATSTPQLWIHLTLNLLHDISTLKNKINEWRPKVGCCDLSVTFVVPSIMTYPPPWSGSEETKLIETVKHMGTTANSITSILVYSFKKHRQEDQPVQVPPFFNGTDALDLPCLPSLRQIIVEYGYGGRTSRAVFHRGSSIAVSSTAPITLPSQPTDEWKLESFMFSPVPPGGARDMMEMKCIPHESLRSMHYTITDRAGLERTYLNECISSCTRLERFSLTGGGPGVTWKNVRLASRSLRYVRVNGTGQDFVGPFLDTPNLVVLELFNAGCTRPDRAWSPMKKLLYIQVYGGKSFMSIPARMARELVLAAPELKHITASGDVFEEVLGMVETEGKERFDSLRTLELFGGKPESEEAVKELDEKIVSLSVALPNLKVDWENTADWATPFIKMFSDFGPSGC